MKLMVTKSIGGDSLQITRVKYDTLDKLEITLSQIGITSRRLRKDRHGIMSSDALVFWRSLQKYWRDDLLKEVKRIKNTWTK